MYTQAFHIAGLNLSNGYLLWGWKHVIGDLRTKIPGCDDAFSYHVSM
uniref:Uncharacterized protein n=1 Tax=Anguilla anguilla TaxID=7936 RepID=A0A0E9SMX7_ANGAN